MPRCRFVQPKVVRLELTDADWIEIKAELNAGETRAIYTDLVKDFHAGEPATLDPTQVGLTKALNYLVNWSFCDASGQSVPISLAALNNLDHDSYQEVIAAIDKHDAAVEEARAARKNGKATLTASSQTST